MTVNDSAVPRRHRRMPLLAAATTLALLGSAGAAVAITNPGVFRNGNGVNVVDSQQLKVQYNGQVITQEDLTKLQAKKLALFMAGDVASAKNGVMHAFDTQAELDAYDASYIARAHAQMTKNGAPAAPSSSPTG